jgi:hypothetical protein
MREGAPQ